MSWTGLSVKTFYGTSSAAHHYTRDIQHGHGVLAQGCGKFQEENKRESKSKSIKPLPSRLGNILGPTQAWKVFRKQNDALKAASGKDNDLMTFAFQTSDSERLFLVVHPQIFWHYDTQKESSKRCSYEIIPENKKCNLYFDLEFKIAHNPEKNGPEIVKTFISVVVHFLKHLWNVEASREDVLDLDSTTPSKFSRHLIFQLKSYIFLNNHIVGEFVHFICERLRQFSNFNTVGTGEHHLLSIDNCQCCHLRESNQYCWSKEFFNSQRSTIEDLFVHDEKNKRRLICDESVYSRNRHFRIFENTKWGKDSPLRISNENLYGPKINSPTTQDIREGYFLDSLVCPLKKDVCTKQVLSFISNPKTSKTKILPTDSNNLSVRSSPLKKSSESSPYPDIDEFINKEVVYPGHIWRSVYFCSTKVIVYDIVGNRYCQNIGRQHKSNNVKIIVNLDKCTYYQKCHDPECASFRSTPKNLPHEISFRLEFDDSFLIKYISEEGALSPEKSSGISDSDLIEVASAIEDFTNTDFTQDFN